MNQEKYDDLLLDKFDISLLAALQKDAHATNQQVGDLIHLSASQVSRRIQRLETTGIIRRYVALLDAAALGLGAAFVAAALVLDCYAVAGESDYILQIVAADLGVLSESVLRVLTRIKGVANIRSNIVLNCIKSSTDLPLGHIGRGDGVARKVRITL